MRPRCSSCSRAVGRLRSCRVSAMADGDRGPAGKRGRCAHGGDRQSAGWGARLRAYARGIRAGDAGGHLHQVARRPAWGRACGPWVRANQMGLQTAGFLGTADGRPEASPESVRPDTDAQADCARKQACKCRPFEAAEGIRTLDLLHGKQSLQFRFHAQSRWKYVFFALVGADEDSTAFHGRPRGFGHRTGTRADPVGVEGHRDPAAECSVTPSRISRSVGSRLQDPSGRLPHDPKTRSCVGERAQQGRPGSRVLAGNAAESDVAGRRVDGLSLARGRAVAEAVVGRAEM